jgi:hypothetical protein
MTQLISFFMTQLISGDLWCQWPHFMSYKHYLNFTNSHIGEVVILMDLLQYLLIHVN